MKKLKRIFKKIINDKKIIVYTYTCVIMGFAIIYWLIPNQFYYSTLVYEENFDNEMENLQVDIEVILNQYLNNNINHLQENDIVYIKDSLEVYNIDLEEDSIHFSIGVINNRDVLTNQDYDYIKIEKIDYKFNIDSSLKINQNNEYYLVGEYIQKDDKVDEEINEVDISELFVLYTKNLDEEDNIEIVNVVKYVFPISDIVFEKLILQHSKVDGQSLEINNISFWRMLYFSIVTGSTLGYGDILPITPLARTLISIEVILCVILMGMFLNALGYSQSKKAVLNNDKKK